MTHVGYVQDKNVGGVHKSNCFISSSRIYTDEVVMARWRVIFGGRKNFYEKHYSAWIKI